MYLRMRVVQIFLLFQILIPKSLIFLMLIVFIIVYLILNLGILNLNGFPCYSLKQQLANKAPWTTSYLLSVLMHIILLNYSHVYYSLSGLYFILTVFTVVQEIQLHTYQNIFTLWIFT